MTCRFAIQVLAGLFCCALLAAQPPQPEDIKRRPVPKDVGKPVTTASGLIYSVLKRGDPKRPQPRYGARVSLHYTGWTEDGKLFETSEYNAEPRRRYLGLTMPRCWVEALQLMRPGARWKITSPAALAFGDRGLPARGKAIPEVKKGSKVTYELVLYGVEEGLALARMPEADPAREESPVEGLKLQVLRPGKGPGLQDGEGVVIDFHLFNGAGQLISTSLHPPTPAIRTRPGRTRHSLPFIDRLASRLQVGQLLRAEVAPQLAYGKQDLGFLLPPGSTSIWLLEVRRFLPAPTPRAVPEFRRLDALASKRLASGLRYQVIEAGSGVGAKKGQSPRFFHVGWLSSGRLFDESYSKGVPVDPSGKKLIPGLEQALAQMPAGAIWLLEIPARLGYGLRGFPRLKIGPNRVLIYQVELVEFASPDK